MKDLGEADRPDHGSATRSSREIRSGLDALRARVRGRPRPRTLLVFERDPGSLRGVYVSGGVGFLHDMLESPAATMSSRTSTANRSSRRSRRCWRARRRSSSKCARRDCSPRRTSTQASARVGDSRVCSGGAAGPHPDPHRRVIWWCRVRASFRATEAFARAASSGRPFNMKILLSWSSGKDSAWALHMLNQQYPGAVPRC